MDDAQSDELTQISKSDMDLSPSSHSFHLYLKLRTGDDAGGEQQPIVRARCLGTLLLRLHTASGAGERQEPDGRPAPAAARRSPTGTRPSSLQEPRPYRRSVPIHRYIICRLNLDRNRPFAPTLAEVASGDGDDFLHSILDLVSTGPLKHETTTQSRGRQLTLVFQTSIPHLPRPQQVRLWSTRFSFQEQRGSRREDGGALNQLSTALYSQIHCK